MEHGDLPCGCPRVRSAIAGDVQLHRFVSRVRSVRSHKKSSLAFGKRKHDATVGGPNCFAPHLWPGSRASLIAMPEIEALEQSLRAQRARLADPMGAQSRLGSSTATGHGNVEEVADIDAALMRIVDGRYGTCLACGHSIAIARLRLLPATDFCFRCARRRPRVSRVDAARIAR